MVALFTTVVMVGSASAWPTLTLSDDELAAQFAKEWGPGSVTITDISGAGVQFDFTGLTSTSGTGVGDNFPVSQLAGGAYKTYGTTQQFSTYGDFSTYGGYSLKFENVGTNPVTVNLKMNTGWTIPPPEYATLASDTYWQNTWTYLGPGETKVVTLDFSCAEVWNAADDPVTEWRYPDGTAGVQVRRIDEVSDIGFQVLGDGAGSIVVSSAEACTEIPEFTTVAIPVAAIIGLLLFFNYRNWRTK